jgi:hypothetical protein
VTQTVFYSWQSDLPNSTNRSLIEQALETAAKTIRSDDSVEVEPVIDRDTAGIAGSPDIANTIFDKIARSTVFVADVSIINSGSRKRRMPNPNVLVELGFALRALGSERVVMVMNSHFGAPDALPFDLKLRRIVTYTSAPNDTTRADVRRELTSRLEGQLRTILSNLESATRAAAATPRADALGEAIRSAKGDRKLLTREYVGDFQSRLFALAPSPAPRDDGALVAALERTAPLIAEFGEISNVVAAAEDTVAAEAIYDSFGNILARYDRPTASSSFHDTEFDFYRFVGHELFVSFVAALVQERQLKLLQRLLAKDLELPVTHRTRLRPFHELQRGSALFWERSNRLNLMSAQGALLRDRHSEGQLGAAVPFDHLLGADYFLFLLTEAKSKDVDRVLWFPPTAPYVTESPSFLIRLHVNEFAITVANSMGLLGSDELRKLIVDSELKLAKAFGLDWNRIPEAYSPLLIGSR